MTIYDAKFTVYSCFQLAEKLRNAMREGNIISEKEIRCINMLTDDLRNVMSEKWDLGKF